MHMIINLTQQHNYTDVLDVEPSKEEARKARLRRLSQRITANLKKDRRR